MIGGAWKSHDLRLPLVFDDDSLICSCTGDGVLVAAWQCREIDGCDLLLQ